MPGASCRHGSSVYIKHYKEVWSVIHEVKQELYIIFQMGWKCYTIALMKYLQSLLCPDVYPEMSECTVTMAPYVHLVLSLLLLRLKHYDNV